jgi:hypothetical protein
MLPRLKPARLPDARTLEEFAVANRISRATAYKEIAAGRLVARKRGKQVLVMPDDEAAWRRALPKMLTAKTG